MDSMIPMGQQMAVPKTSQTEMMISRQAQEVQGAIVMAKKFPRDEYDAMERIKRTCQRATLAEQAIYSYPRGGQTVMGPSIRLAEALAQNWGNIDYGVIELEQKNGSSEMMAYAWDLESNTRVTKIFTVEHKRDTRKGTYQLTDSRDIYEATANFGARRMRACILGVIPGDVVDMAVGECKETVRKGIGKEPINERVTKLINAFKVEFKENMYVAFSRSWCDNRPAPFLFCKSCRNNITFYISCSMCRSNLAYMQRNHKHIRKYQ